MHIKPIDSSVYKHISSSTSVDSALAAIKELIDNSIDANGTTSISIEIDKETGGLEQIKVKDNGSGIHPDDRAVLCLEGYTSKISSIKELASIRSFGFRGVALSSLCNLSVGNFLVTTMCEGDQCAA